MTIAIGLLASDGLVIAADTQETLGGFLKMQHGKVSAVLTVHSDNSQSLERSGILTGAGSGHHIDALGRTMIDAIYHGESKSDETIQKEIEALLKSFYLDHVVPFAAYPENDRPEFQLLLGLQNGKGRDKLLVSEKTVFRDASPYVAIGVGALAAYPLLLRFYQLPIPDVRAAVLLAAYVLNHVKDAVEGCGKASDIVGIKSGRYFSLRRQQVKELEQAVGEYAESVEPMMLRRITGLDIAQQQPKARRAEAKLKRLMSAITFR